MRTSALLLPAFALICSAAENKTDASRYQDTANKLIDAALADEAGLNRLEYLCYRIGNRLSGSAALDQAIAWGAEEMKQAGLENVRTIPVKVPLWGVRGRRSAGDAGADAGDRCSCWVWVAAWRRQPDGITADVVAVSSFDELEKLGRGAVEGKIVLCDAPFVGYDKTVAYRSNGASRAARLGAVAALVRSITARSLRDPHTGATQYSAADPKIPTAAVSVEDAMWIHGLTRAGQEVRVHLAMEAHTEPDADSADVVGEIVGREKADRGGMQSAGHIDSWDVGQWRAATMAAESWRRLGRWR